jgi:hypothetical protein
VSRVELDESNSGYSEAVWNEKALKVLPEEGLALIPFTSGYMFNSSAGARTTRPSFVQLVDISLQQGGTLQLRGRLEHDFEPRRAALVNGILTSISQKELITANIDDRDNPAVLAEVALAWPVNQVIQSGTFVLQISDGASAVWSGESAVVRISKVSSENAILADLDLGAGTVQDAVLRDSKLYVLRKNWGPYTPMVRFVRRPGSIAPSASEPELALDIYDASALPALPRLGSTAITMTNADTNCTLSNLLWATDTLPVVITQARPWYGYFYPMICGQLGGDIPFAALGRMSASALAMAPEADNTKPSLRAGVIRAFDVRNPKTPTALPGVPLPATSSTVITASGAGDGLVVFGYGESPSPWRPRGWPSELDQPLACFNRVGMVNLSNPRRPVIGSPVLLPGKLFAVTDISRSGFLAFTESVSTESTPADKDPKSANAMYATPAEPTRQVQASLVADSQASMIASIPVALDAKLAAQGRNVYCSASNRIDRYTLSDEASFVNTGSATTNWTPAEIQMRGTSVFGAYGNQLMRISWPGLDGVVEDFKASQWFDLTRLTLSLDGSLLVPMGDYGVENLMPVSASLMTLSAPTRATRLPDIRLMPFLTEFAESRVLEPQIVSLPARTLMVGAAPLNMPTLTATLPADSQRAAVSMISSGSGAGELAAESGTLTLTGPNLEAGGTNFIAGLRVISAGAASWTGALPTLHLSSDSQRATASVIHMIGRGSGAGVLTVGSGGLTLTGTNMFMGGTSLVAGSLVIGTSSAIWTGTLSISSGVTTSGGTLFFAESNAGTAN